MSKPDAAQVQTVPPRTIPKPGGCSSPTAWKAAWITGCLAARQNRFPAVVLWLFGVTVIVGYFFVPPVQELLDSVGRVKTTFGWKFSLVSTGIFGGLIPAMISRLLQHNGAKHSLGLIVSNTLLWAYKGVEIDFFYRFQAWLFGTTANFQTIAVKTICDQFLMVPLFGLVNVVLFYVWRDCGYSFGKLWSVLGPNWYQKIILPVLIANWVIWIPAVAMIYCLPVALQLPVQNLILCFWVLILMFFTNKKTKTVATL